DFTGGPARPSVHVDGRLTVFGIGGGDGSGETDSGLIRGQQPEQRGSFLLLTASIEQHERDDQGAISTPHRPSPRPAAPWRPATARSPSLRAIGPRPGA